MYSYEHLGRMISPVPGFIEELKTLVPESAKTFLEWGAGCSTLLFQEIAKERGGEVLTMEHDPNWLAAVARNLDYPGSEILLKDLDGPRQNQQDGGFNYSTYPSSLGKKFDFIMIDGRRRLECALASLVSAHKDTVIVLHDYRRTRYQLVKVLYDTQDGPQFRRLFPRGIS